MPKPVVAIPKDLIQSVMNQVEAESTKDKNAVPVHEHTAHVPEHVKSHAKSNAHNSGGPTRTRSCGRGK